MNRNLRFAVSLLLGTFALLSFSGCGDNGLSEPVAGTTSAGSEKPAYKFTTLSNPRRVEVTYGTSWAATFTYGSYTVTLAGPSRTFSETNTVGGNTYSASVSHSVWVRTLSSPFTGFVSTTWLNDALAANNAGVPDILDIAMQYIDGAADVNDSNGQKIAGDADYGPLDSLGKRIEGSDFNDYLGISWTYSYSDYTDNPESNQIGALDCSGFMRMVWGYRHSLEGYGYGDRVPLMLDPTPSVSAMPRKSFQIYDAAPGTVIISNSGSQATSFTGMNVGDLVFFDADTSAADGSQLDHVGMYMGVDANGKRRFISSRKSINGPTMGDYQGSSLLDKYVKKNGVDTPVLYTAAFRAARRL